MVEFTPLEIVGLVSLSFIAFCILKKIVVIFYRYVIGPVINKVDFKAQGRWALITGATDGIGKEYARQLAAKGCDIILVSRSLDKLKTCAQEIEKEFKVSTKVIQADFSTDEIYDKIATEIKDLDIGTLVNNVGIYYQYPEYFLRIPQLEKLTRDMANANMISVVRMTHLILPQMLKKKKGVIINVSSLSAAVNVPSIIVYAASKAFVDHFTVGLQQEYRNSGVIIQSLITGGVVTKLSNLKESFMTPQADKYVKSALSTVGTESRTTGFIPHTLGCNIYNWLYSINKDLASNLGARGLDSAREEVLNKIKKGKS